MLKDFSKWHSVKEQLDKREDNVFFHEREIWWCCVGCNVGFEQDGKHEDFSRPVLVLAKFNKFSFWGVPLTHTLKDSRFYFKFNVEGVTDESAAIISQLRMLDVKRLTRKVGIMGIEEFKSLRSAVKNLLP